MYCTMASMSVDFKRSYSMPECDLHRVSGKVVMQSSDSEEKVAGAYLLDLRKQQSESHPELNGHIRAEHTVGCAVKHDRLPAITLDSGSDPEPQSPEIRGRRVTVDSYMSVAAAGDARSSRSPNRRPHHRMSRRATLSNLLPKIGEARM